MEGEVGITHMYKAKNIFNSFATPGLKTLNNKASTWNLIQLRLRPAIESHKCARFCSQQIHGIIQLLRALTAPQWPHKNLGSKRPFTSALQLLPQAASEDLRITGWKSCGIPGVGRETRVINRQVPLLPGQRHGLPTAGAKSPALNVHMLVHQSSPLKLILKKSSGTSWSSTVKLSPVNDIGVHTSLYCQKTPADPPSEWGLALYAISLHG